MKKIILLISVFIIFLLSFSVEISSLKNLLPINPKATPDTATNINLAEFVNYVPVNSFILCYAAGRCGGGDIDTLYDASLRVEWFEEVNNSSFNVRNVGLQDTSIVQMNNGEVIFYIENTDTELVSVKVVDPSLAKKSSFYSVYKFVEKADSATKIGTIKDTLLSLQFGLSIFVTYQDDSNKIFFDYGTIMQDSTIMLRVLNDDNNTVVISSMEESSSDTLYPNIINGGYFLSITDSEIEEFDIEFTPLLTTYPLNPETVHFISLPNEESPAYLVFSFEGYNQTAGIDRNMLCLNMAENGPVSTNNTSAVKTNLYDMTGDGGTISTTDWQQLTSGVAQFSITSPNPNECLVLENLTDGTPQLYNMTKFIGFEYKDIGKAIYGTAYGPKVGAVGDTLLFDAYVTDAFINTDVGFNGISKLSGDSDLVFLNINTLSEDAYPEIENGYSQFLVTESNEGRRTFRFNDGEGSFIHQYFNTRNSFDGQELNIEWKYPSVSPASTLQLYLPNNNLARLDWNEPISISALVNDSIDITNASIVNISATGNASLSDTLITLNRGTGTFYISDTIPEDVIITVTSAGLTADNDTLSFFDNSKAAILLGTGKNECIINEQSNLVFFAMTPSFVCDTAFDGHIELSATDSNGDTLSFSFIDYPQNNIPINDGIGMINVLNSEAENVIINGIAISDSDTIFLDPMSFRVYYQLVGAEGASVVVGISDTFSIFSCDIDSSIMTYSSKIDTIYVYEDNPNNSFLYPIPPAGYDIINGECSIGVNQSENENVDIYGYWIDSLIINSGIETYILSLSSVNGIKSMFKKNLPQFFSISLPYPNPMESSNSIQFSIPVSEEINVKIYDKIGREVRNLFKSNLTAGNYILKFNGKDNLGNELPSGRYMYVISSKGKVMGAKSFIKL